MAVTEAMYAAAVIADGPQTYLKGGYPSWPGAYAGWFTDASGFGRHSTGGTGTSTITGSALLPWMSGSFGFAGGDATSYVEFANNPVSTAGDFTVEFWFKRTGNGVGGGGASGGIGYGALLSKNGAGANQDFTTYVGRDAPYDVVGFIEPGGTDTYIGTGLAPLNEVHHHAFTVTGTTAKSYFDGRLANSITLPAGARPNAGNWRLGKSVNTFWGVPTGMFAHVAWYSKVLAPGAIAHHYNLATHPQGERWAVSY